MHSIIGSWLTLYVSALESYGINGKEFLALRNIHYPQSSDPSCRIDLATMRQLWDDAIAVTQDPCIGLRAGTFVTPHTFSTLGLAISSCCSIHDMLQLLCRYLQLFNTGCEMTLNEAEDATWVSVELPKDEDGNFLVSTCGIDASMSAIYSMIGAYNLKGLSPTSITFPYAEPSCAEQHRAFFGCPVTFGGDALHLCYDTKRARQPIPGGNEAIAKSAENLVIAALEQVKTDGILLKVRESLVELLGEGEANIKNVASRLNTSSRTLHRRLEEQGTNFRELLDSVRQEQALKHMKNTKLTVEDVGFMLGFSSHSNYSRAFKRWTGVTPRDFRSNLSQIPA